MWKQHLEVKLKREPKATDFICKGVYNTDYLIKIR